MKKERHAIVIFAFIILAFFVVLILNNPQFTGFAVYESQPDSSLGKDTYIRSDLPSSNFGSASTLSIGKTASGADLRALFEFNTSTIPSQDTVINAQFQFYVSSSEGNQTTIYAYRIIQSWEETQASWTNRTSTDLWITTGGRYNSAILGSISVNNTGLFNITVTDAANGWINGTYSNLGIILIAQNASNGDIKGIYSSDYADDALLRPKLFVEHSPNAPPVIKAISTNSELPSPKKPGQNVTFTINWTDPDSSQARAFICNSSSISLSGCAGKELCNTSLSTTSPAICSYNITSSDNRTTNFWVSVCDGANCSSANQSYFHMNHLPLISIDDPSEAGITINQSAGGNYLVVFTVSDSDSDWLFADIYYGTTQNSTTYSVASNLNLTQYISNGDANTATPNICNYSWNTTGIYGTYYLTIVLNDSYHNVSDSSNNSFTVLSLQDSVAPDITAQWIENTDIYSGKSIYVYANASDANLNSVWISFNYTSVNYSMSNISDATFRRSFTAPKAGIYKFKVYANDTVGNINNSLDWEEFIVRAPNATTQNETVPSTALPYHVIKFTGQINATDALSNVYAYLNVPEGFSFLSNYSQNLSLGNINANQTRTATWYISVPLTENTYILNITYSDAYGNIWRSNNSNILVSSVTGGTGYILLINGYPEVVTGSNYYVESYFTQGSTYVDPDSAYISIYDASGNLIVGPALMSQKSTGINNYSYTIGSSVTEGDWETIINATKSGLSYYAHEFWQVIGGPFDVRNITVINTAVNNLEISVITENTGGANKDLTLTWNLTRADNGELLDSGSETFMVNANSTRTHTVYPTTNYVGQVRITFLGFYGPDFSEKAGAYKIFSTTSEETPVTPPTTSGGGGGGGASLPAKNRTEGYAIELDGENIIYLTKNVEKRIKIKLTNIGEKELTNISLTMKGVEQYTKISPFSINVLKEKESSEFEIIFLIKNLSEEKEFEYLITANEIEESMKGKIILLELDEYLLKELERLKARSRFLHEEINSTKLESELSICEDQIKILEKNINAQKIIEAKDNINKADICLDAIEEKLIQKQAIIRSESWKWIITWFLILLLIITLLIIAFFIYRKFGILEFLKKEKAIENKQDKTPPKQEYIEDKLKDIRKKLNE